MPNVSAVPALLDALVAALTTALPSVTVYDGPGVSDAGAGDYLMVGVPDPDADTPDAAVETTVGWAGLGARSRDERSVVWCTAVSWSGDTDVKAVRDRAFASFTAVETVLTGDPSLGDAHRFGGIAETHRLRQNVTADGAEAWVVFGLSFHARLAG